MKKFTNFLAKLFMSILFLLVYMSFIPCNINKLLSKNTDTNTGVENVCAVALDDIQYEGQEWLNITHTNQINYSTKSMQTTGSIEGIVELNKAIYGDYSTTESLSYILDGDVRIKQIQQTLNQYYSNYFTPLDEDGFYAEKTNKAIIYALQAELGMDTTKASGYFGPETYERCPNLSVDSTETSIITLVQYALYCNGFYKSGGFHGLYDAYMEREVQKYQEFMCLPRQDGVADKDTILSLLMSTGQPTRPATACDTAVQLSDAQVQALKDTGIKYVGRYLTKVSGGLDKDLSVEEAQRIIDGGLKIFLIYQTCGNNVDYFTNQQGYEDGIQATLSAVDLGIPYGSTIYFCVDYNVLNGQISNNIIPYFKSLNASMRALGSKYKIGIYASRNVCTRISARGYATYSFVSDMSYGYQGNMGAKMPKNWSFDQIQGVCVQGEGCSIGIDKDVASGRDKGISYLDDSIGKTEIYEMAKQISK